MHSALFSSNDIDSNLYPALLQVFTIILVGYLAGTLKILSKEQSTGLNIFVGTFILPALLLKNIAVLDFSLVDWRFIGSVFVSKSLVFFAAIFFTLITLKPLNLGLAAVFAIFVSQSNDFALGLPIVDAIYSESHPNFLNYIYLLAPISLCILNPIAFFLLEFHEQSENNKALKEKSEYELINDEEGEENKEEIHSLDEPLTSEDFLKRQKFKKNNSFIFEEELTKKPNPKKIGKFSNRKLIKHTLWSTVSNPIVFMTFVGLIVNVTFKQKIPSYFEPIVTTLANSFSAISLFYLGFTMVGKIKNLTFSMIVIIIILIFTKSLLFPLLTREMVNLFEDIGTPSIKNETTTKDLSTFGFLFGTFPSAPSLLSFIARYRHIEQDLISSAIVFGTLVSAPLMMVSGKMIAIEFVNDTSTNFEDIQCKTAYGFSFATLFCGIWVLYIFLASGRIFFKTHRYTFLLIVSQMMNSLIHIIWASSTDEKTDVNKYLNYTYVFISLFAAFLTRCIPLSIMLSLMSISKIRTYSNSKFNRIFFKLADSGLFLLSIGILLPLSAAILCISVGNIPANQGMMISVGKGQITISCFLLIFLIISISYCLIVFARTKFHEESILSIVSNKKIRFYSSSDTSDDKIVTNSSSDMEESYLISNQNSTHDFFKSRIQSLNLKYQIMQHIALIVILLFVTLMCLFVQFWSLNNETVSGIFYVLQLLDTTLLYGQGFFLFMTFGLDSDLIFQPFLFKIKEVFRIIKPFELLPEVELTEQTIDLCKRFERQYKDSCANSIEKDKRFHHNFYNNVFSGAELIDWFIENKLIKTRKQGRTLGIKLIQGRIMYHVSLKRDFHDGYHLYKFYS